MALRAVSNLNIPEEFKLSKHERSSGFLFFYNSKFSEEHSELIFKLIFQPFFPITRTDAFLKGKFVKPDKVLKEDLALKASCDSSVLKKSGPKDKGDGFFFSCPLLTSARGDIREAGPQEAWLKKLMDYKSLENTLKHVELKAGIIQTRSFAADLKISGTTINALNKSLVHLEITDKGEIWSKWFITKREAEFLTCSKFATIRPANLYVPLISWIGSDFGDKVYLPQASLPITHIKQKVNEVMKKGEVVHRNKIDDICVIEDGDLVWIPEVDSAIKYEQSLHDFGIQGDGSYTFGVGSTGLKEFRINDKDDDESKKKLPNNMPIFTDWVNLKFAYSNTNGILDVLDLERAVKLTAFHVRDFLDQHHLAEEGAVFKHLKNAYEIATQIDDSVSISPTQGELEWGKLKESDATAGLLGYMEKAIRNIFREGLGGEEVKREEDLRIRHFASNSEIISLRPIGRSLEKAFKVCEEHIDNVYRRYSVWTTIRFMARLKLFSKYSKNFAEIVVRDNKKRAPYLNQGVDPKHKPEALPNIGTKFEENGYMPHQAKAENLMRESPEFGIYSVSAGGGKTILILTNILMELKRKHCKRPLVLCPAHLVADYIKEATYVTEGKLNVIAITTQTMRYHGAERLKKMIEVAPINTVFVTDYNFIKGKGEELGYGIKPVTVYRNVEFLRLFGFDLISIDESHFLKNVSLRSESAHRFISEIPMKRLASGTIVHDTVTDIVAQFALLDPTVFGDKDKFLKDYAAEVRGGKVMAWKPNAQRMIHAKMREHCVFIDCKRKEWAARLPEPDEVFHGVELTEKQMMVYQSVLQSTIELIEAAMAKDPKLRKAMQEAEDENRFDQLASLLKPYLSRLEQYLAAPYKDPLGKEVLTEIKDKTSPKVKKIIQICRKHLGIKHDDQFDKNDSFKGDKPIFGKILIFTNHIEVAEEIYESLPPDLKKMCIHYKAGEKMEARAEFEKNPNKMIMVGVEKSMNTGLNFQFVSRLIRVETVWTPGEMEQGNSRINRPELKKKDLRKNIYFDWIIVNKTFDITKASRLMAKMIQNAKFDEPENPEYQNIPDVELIPMTLGTIQEMNDWETTLTNYAEAYKTYKTVQAEDYEQYRIKNKDKMDAVEVPSAGLLPGSKLMAKVPYVPGMELYGTDQLGLIRYDEFMRKDIEYELEEDEEGEDDEEEESTDSLRAATRARNKDELKKVLGLAVHTEWGDGEIVGVASKIVKVRLRNGEMVRSRKLATFIIQRKDTNSKDIRNQLLKMAGKLPIDAPIDVPADKGIMKRGSKVVEQEMDDEEQVKEAIKKKKEKPDQSEKNQEEESDMKAAFNFVIINDFLGISFKDLDNSAVVAALQNIGFRMAPEYYFARLKTAQNVVDLVKTWKAKGFVYPGYLNKRMKQLYDALKNKAQLKTFGFANKIDLKNFYTREFKPGSSQKEIKPYPLVVQDQVYIALPAQAQIGTRNAIKVNVPGIVWKHRKAAELICFVLNKPGAKQVLKKILGAGIEITNKKELKSQFEKLKIVSRKSGNDDD